MSDWSVRVVPNRYADSVRLMAVAGDIRARDGVDGCEIAIGTPANLEALGVPVDCSPSDLVIAVRGSEADGALDAAESALTEAAGSDGGSRGAGAVAVAAPRSLPSAVARMGGGRAEDASVALISVPGDYAALVAHQALSRGMHAFVFSDHVTVDQEIALKRRGAERGLLVMGPECGTAMLGQVGLGFANVVRRGPVGVVAAAGTGAQEVACLIDAAGSGVSHIIGVGGRDLSAQVGGIMFREGMRRLAEDDETETLLLVSKPPAQQVVDGLGEVDTDGKRVVAAFVGGGELEAPFELHRTLEGAAWSAAGGSPPGDGDLEREVDARRDRGGERGDRVLGLFSGGSLCHEASTILGDRHELLDLGGEEYTQGRPHPMVDPSLRVAMLEKAASDDSLGCVLVDVVLGRASHADPAGALAPALSALAERMPVIAHVCGTRGDPQDSDRQTRTLRDAGVITAPSNAAAARLARRAVGEGEA